MWKFVFPVLAALLAVGLGGLVGGPTDIDIDNAGAREALDFAVVQHNRRTNDQYWSKDARVVRVQRQVVSGLMYLITVEMGRTSCRKDSMNENQPCNIIEDEPLARNYTCTFKVWNRPWLNDIRLEEDKC